MKRMMLMFAVLALLLCGCTAPDDTRTNDRLAQETRAAVQEVDYAPERAVELQSATLTWTLDREDREVMHASALTEENELRALEAMLCTAVPSNPAGTFPESVQHELTLACRDGAVIRLDVAVDDGCVLRDGETYYTFDASQENAGGLYALFGAAQ